MVLKPEALERKKVHRKGIERAVLGGHDPNCNDSGNEAFEK